MMKFTLVVLAVLACEPAEDLTQQQELRAMRGELRQMHARILDITARVHVLQGIVPPASEHLDILAEAELRARRRSSGSRASARGSTASSRSGSTCHTSRAGARCRSTRC